ncbi:DNA ligase 1-like, partial [Saccostrea cucullata]|uniref:DNA ligase 1-like n=1 Tax=Saccostrea cuccullata TaxID=36930 RepID=UPI002ED5FA54
FKTGAEKAKYYRELKNIKAREIQLKKYNERKLIYNAKKREKRLKEKANSTVTKEAARQKGYRDRKKREKEELERKRIERNKKKREYRERVKNRQDDQDEELQLIFNSRTQKHRALKKLKQNLPSTPKKRAALISTYMSSQNSPTAKLLQKFNKTPSPDDVKKIKMADALLSDMKTVINENKLKRSDDARATINVLSAAVSGENVQQSKCRTELSKKLGFNENEYVIGFLVRKLRRRHTLPEKLEVMVYRRKRES